MTRMTRKARRGKDSLVDLVLSRWPLLILEYLLLLVAAGFIFLKRADLAGILNYVAYATFLVWNATYGITWYHWAKYQPDEHAKVKPQSIEVFSTIVESIHNFSNAGVNAVNILLPVNIAVVGFLAAANKPVGGLLQPAFFFSISLAVALWNLSRLPTMVHKNEDNPAYDSWTAFFEMLQLSTLMLGIIRLLTELFMLFGE